MESRAKALLEWLQIVTQTPIRNLNETRNAVLFQSVLNTIEGFSFVERAPSQEWKENYSRLKCIYEQLEAYLKDVLQISPPSSLSVMNLVQISKGQSQEGAETLMHIVFIVCIRCPLKEDFIRAIMKLSNEAQTELMQIIQQWQNQQESKEENSEAAYYRQEIARIEFLYNNLNAENASLRSSVQEDYERGKRDEELIGRLQKENQQLQKELSDKTQQLRVREENFIDKYAQHNEDIVQQLKKTLMEREQQHSQIQFALKQTIYSLQEALGQSKKTNQDLQEQQTRRSFIQNRQDHSGCISIQKHKAKVNELLALSKESTQKEINAKLQNIQLKNINAELQSKGKKLAEELRKKETDMMISSEDGYKLKIQFFSRVRDSLKQKLSDYKSKDAKQGSGNNIAFLDDQA